MDAQGFDKNKIHFEESAASLLNLWNCGKLCRFYLEGTKQELWIRVKILSRFEILPTQFVKSPIPYSIGSNNTQGQASQKDCIYVVDMIFFLAKKVFCTFCLSDIIFKNFSLHPCIYNRTHIKQKHLINLKYKLVNSRTF